MKKAKEDHPAADRDLYAGMMRLHVLHWHSEELARHGYRISPGTLYPLLHGLEKKGYIRSTEKRNGKSLRTLYQATPLGHRALTAAKIRVRELIGELFEGNLGQC